MASRHDLLHRHLAFCAWQNGDGALANVALDRALADNPRYSMAAESAHISIKSEDKKRSLPIQQPQLAGPGNRLAA